MGVLLFLSAGGPLSLWTGRCCSESVFTNCSRRGNEAEFSAKVALFSASLPRRLRFGSGEFFGHSHQVGKGLRFQLLHDVGTVEFDRSLGSSEFAGGLFIKHSGGNERHDLTLTRS